MLKPPGRNRCRFNRVFVGDPLAEPLNSDHLVDI